MIYSVLSILLLAAQATPPPVQAPAQGSSPKAGPAETTQDMRAEAGARLRAAEAKRTEVQERLQKRLGGRASRIRLQASDLAWKRYRDAQAAFEASFYQGGTIQAQIQLDALATLTRARTQELQHILDTETGR